MADAIITRFRSAVNAPHPIEAIELIPGGSGIFDVDVDGKVVFSKYVEGRHAEQEEILTAVASLPGS